MVLGLSMEVFAQVGLVIIIAAFAAFIFRLLRQPPILAYVVTGILLTPVFHLVTNVDLIESMSIIGIAFLLFIVGLEMDIKSLRTVALVSTVGGTIQIIILFVLGFLTALLLGFLPLEATYLGMILAFSSTMIVLKLLSDRRELQTLHGRIVIGILLVEDVVAIFALSILSAISGFTWALLGMALLKFLAILAIAFLTSRYLFPHVFRFAARTPELLFISALAVVFLFSLALQYMGLSMAIGAFVAGVALGNLDYSLEISGKVKSLKDFFSLLFFVALGMDISLSIVKEFWMPLLAFTAIVLLLKPIIVMTICSLFKYTKKPAFLTATSLAQVSELSVIIVAQGLILGHLSQELFSLAVLITLITITVSTYYIKYDEELYHLFRRPLQLFDRFTTKGLEYLPEKTLAPTIILCGYNRIGYSVLKGLHDLKKRLLVIDYNPEIIDQLMKRDIHCLYGDATDDEIMEKMNLPHIKMLISTVPRTEDNLLLIRAVRRVNQQAKIIVTTADIDTCLKLYEAGADYVIMPHFLGGMHVSNLLTKMRTEKKILHQEKQKHMEELQERKQLGQEHPPQQ